LGTQSVQAFFEYWMDHYGQIWGISLLASIPLGIAANIAYRKSKERLSHALGWTAFVIAFWPALLVVLSNIFLPLIAWIVGVALTYTWFPAYFLAKYLGWAWAITIVASLWAAIVLAVRWRRSVLAKRVKALIAQEEPAPEREPPPEPSSPEHMELLPQPPRKRALTEWEFARLREQFRQERSLSAKLAPPAPPKPPPVTREEVCPAPKAAKSVNGGQENEGETGPPGQQTPKVKPRITQPRLPLAGAPMQRLNPLHNLLWFRAQKKNTPVIPPPPAKR